MVRSRTQHTHSSHTYTHTHTAHTHTHTHTAHTHIAKTPPGTFKGLSEHLAYNYILLMCLEHNPLFSSTLLFSLFSSSLSSLSVLSLLSLLSQGTSHRLSYTQCHVTYYFSLSYRPCPPPPPPYTPPHSLTPTHTNPQTQPPSSWHREASSPHSF